MQRTAWQRLSLGLAASFGLQVACVGAASAADDVLRIDQRFANEAITETPDFRQHVVPLMGKLGCNGRACHGSFQGQGGFRLSLFGYDFKADHEALAKADKDKPARINSASIHESLMLQKPLQVVPHEGGTRLKEGTWQHRVLVKWLEGGAKPVTSESAEFVRLELSPTEIVAKKKGETFQFKATAVWSTGVREDVTPLCRFRSNNDTIVTIDDTGLATSTGPGDSHIVAFYDNGVVPVPVMLPVSDKFGPNYPKVPTPTKIDELVVQKLRKVGVVQSDLSSDSEFLRRVSLDMIGTLPTAAEVEAFLADNSSDKRAKKIDELLERPAYAAWWATRFSDWTGNNAAKLQNVEKAQIAPAKLSADWYEWLRVRIEKNMPYDDMMEGIVLAVSRQQDESYTQYSERMSGYYQKDAKESFADQPSMTHYWVRREFLKPEERALGFAYTFLGLRIQCAQCHKHPFDQWTKDDFDRFKEFFSRLQYRNSPGTGDEEKALLAKLDVNPDELKKKQGGQDLRKVLLEHLNKGEVVPFNELHVPAPVRQNRQADRKADKDKPNAKRQQVIAGRTAKILGGDEVQIGEMNDPREALMDWMRDKDNPYFSRAIVNRIWSGYFNVGIVEPTDDLSLANPPSNDALLDYLADSFREHGYDLKWLHREIANSRTYQLSFQPNDTNRQDEHNFARAVPRRLPAEVAYDAVRLATMSDFESAKWATSVAGRAIADSYVNNRNDGGGGKGNNSSYATTIFGRSIRDTNCECDRSTEASLLQTVFLQNDDEVLKMIGDKGRWVDQVVKRGEPEKDSKEAPAIIKARQARKLAERGIDDLRGKLAQFEKSGNTKRIEAMKQAIAAQEAKLANTPAAAEPDQKPEVAAIDTVSIIRQAYLRSLSRYPTDSEVARATKYYEETEDVARGTKDLLWALINTKEFIVNH